MCPQLTCFGDEFPKHKKDTTDAEYNIVRDMGSVLDIDFWQFMEKDE